MERALKVSVLTCSAVAGATILTLLVGFVPQYEATSLWRPVSTEVRTLSIKDMPQVTTAAPYRGTNVRGLVSHSIKDIATHSTKHKEKASTSAWLTFTTDSVNFYTTYGTQNLTANTSHNNTVPVLPLHEYTDLTPLVSTQPTDYGESFTVDGQPLRWAIQKDNAHTAFNAACSVHAKGYSPPKAALALLAQSHMYNKGILARAQYYKDLIDQAAQRFQLHPALLYAIIQTESNFLPSLVSTQSAMGLMQILPSTAGGEVHTYLHGYPAIVSPEELARPDINIRFGAAYIHLLRTRHLHGIHDKKSQEYCILAAYNMGPNRLLRFFGKTREEAFAAINALNADEVYQRLTTVLPVAETRAYVARVTRRQERFKNFP